MTPERREKGLEFFRYAREAGRDFDQRNVYDALRRGTAALAWEALPELDRLFNLKGGMTGDEQLLQQCILQCFQLLGVSFPPPEDPKPVEELTGILIVLTGRLMRNLSPYLPENQAFVSAATLACFAMPTITPEQIQQVAGEVSHFSPALNRHVRRHLPGLIREAEHRKVDTSRFTQALEALERTESRAELKLELTVSYDPKRATPNQVASYVQRWMALTGVFPNFTPEEGYIGLGRVTLLEEGDSPEEARSLLRLAQVAPKAFNQIGSFDSALSSVLGKARSRARSEDEHFLIFARLGSEPMGCTTDPADVFEEEPDAHLVASDPATCPICKERGQ